jgi:hypothetical protein
MQSIGRPQAVIVEAGDPPKIHQRAPICLRDGQGRRSQSMNPTPDGSENRRSSAWIAESENGHRTAMGLQFPHRVLDIGRHRVKIEVAPQCVVDPHAYGGHFGPKRKGGWQLLLDDLSRQPTTYRKVRVLH